MVGNHRLLVYIRLAIVHLHRCLNRSCRRRNSQAKAIPPTAGSAQGRDIPLVAATPRRRLPVDMTSHAAAFIETQCFQADCSSSEGLKRSPRAMFSETVLFPQPPSTSLSMRMALPFASLMQRHAANVAASCPCSFSFSPRCRSKACVRKR